MALEWCRNCAILAHMDMGKYVERLRELLAVAVAAGGDEAEELAQRLIATLDSAMRLVLLEALSTAADEITREMAPGSVEVRLRQGEPEFVVALPPAEEEFEEVVPAVEHAFDSIEGDEAGTARLNLRMPATLKQRIEDAARAEGLSLNAWLVRAANAAIGSRPRTWGPAGGDRFTGWVR